MKVAAQAEFGHGTDQSLQMRDEPLQIFPVIVVAVVGVRRGHLVSDAVFGRHLAHGDGNVPRLGAVVYFRKNVGMNIDHDNFETQAGAEDCACFNLSRFAGKEKAGTRYQMVGTARDLRISRSAVSRGMSSTRAVAAIILSAGSF